MLTRMPPLLTRMARMLTRMARMLTRMTRWLAGSHIIHTQSSLRFASLLFNIVNVSSLRFNKLCLHPFVVSIIIVAKVLKARQQFSVLTWD